MQFYFDNSNSYSASFNFDLNTEKESKAASKFSVALSGKGRPQLGQTITFGCLAPSFISNVELHLQLILTVIAISPFFNIPDSSLVLTV